MVFDNFPWTNYHELNLDWIIRHMKIIQEMTGQTRSFYQATGVAEATTALTAGTITQIPLASAGSIAIGSAFEISTDGGIRVKEAGTYKVDASAYIHAKKDSTSIGVYIYKGDNIGNAVEVTSARIAQDNSSFGFYGAFSVAPKLVNLAAGQSVYLLARVNGEDGDIDDDNTATFLLIERVD